MANRSKHPRPRGPAITGKGYGTQRRILFEHARTHIERSIAEGFFCEAIAIIESVISDRLESRVSYLTKSNVGFETLGYLLGELRRVESDSEMLAIALETDEWRKKRNGALHELVKVEANKPVYTWQDRMRDIAVSASEGYEILKRVYHRVAALNPKHLDRVFPPPSKRSR